MEFFQKAKSPKLAVRLKSHHNKYLLAEEDGAAAVKQHGNGTAAAARWSVEIVGDGTLIRLKSVKTNMYLSPSNDSFRIGLTGKTVVQAFTLTDSVEWAPVKEGDGRLMLRTRAGTFLCANGSFPPWRNAVTHDMLCTTASVDWAIWVVDVVDRDSDAAGDGSPASSVMRRTCSIPAKSVGGNEPPSPAGSIRSVRTMSPRQQSTKLSNSFNIREPNIDVGKPIPPVVRMAMQTFMEVQELDFNSAFYSKRLKHVETAISILLSYYNTNNNDNYRRLTCNSKLLSLQDQLQILKLDKERDTKELLEYMAFKERKENMKAELQREVGKARELQGRDTTIGVVLKEVRGKREQLKRELEKVERMIKIAEEEEEKNEAEMEGLCRIVGWRSESLKEMEKEENVWVKRKAMAERKIMEVEDHWNMIKDFF